MSLDVAIIGAGKIGHKHARILDTAHDVSVSYIVDIDDAAANELADIVDASPDIGLEAALSGCDVAYVCTPDDAHTDIAAQAIKADVHTFVEKPLATQISEADRLVEASVSSDHVHMVGHILRFDPRYQTLNQRIQNNKLGSILTVTADRLVPRARARRTGAVSGPAMRLGVHDFDLLEWMIDDTIKQVRAKATDGALREQGYDTEDTITVRAEFTGEWWATLTLGYCVPNGHPDSIVRMKVVGTDGISELDASAGPVQQWDADSGTYPDTDLWPTVQGVPDGALANEDRMFIEAIRTEKPSPVPYSAGRRALAVARAVERAADTDTLQPVE